jgi:PAS domain S-box-containing protein
MPGQPSYDELLKKVQELERIVSEHKQIGEALRESERILNETGKMGKVGGWEHDFVTGKATWTEALFDIVEIPYDREPPGTEEHLSYYPPQYRKILEQAYNLSVKEGIPFDVQLQGYTATRSLKWWRVQGESVFENGKCVKMRGVLQDITDRKQTEEALRKSQTHLRTLLNTLPDLVWLKAPDGVYLACNSRFERFFGAKEAEITGKTDYDFVDKKLADHFRQRDEVAMAANKPCVNEEEIQYADDGHKELLETIKTPMYDTEGRIIGVLGIARDITERKKLEERVLRAQKMESIGNLAGGIAHDFNNILSAVMGYTELALSDVEEKTAMHDYLQEIFHAGQRAKDLVKQILTFSRQTDQERKPVQVKPIAKEALKFLRASLPATIEIRQDIRSDSLVMADPTQIHQVFMNLCTNAEHAMREKGGVLEVGLRDVDLDEKIAGDHPELKPGKFLGLTVTDSGRGIPADLLNRIFDPFFTTKEKGEGTGMGLSVVHGIVGSCGGAITATSEPGAGSTFTVYLPVITRHVKIQPEDKEPVPTGTDRVLFIDDEPALVDIGKQTLESLGYQVTTRTSGMEALELFKARPHDFDLVITDMTMPNMAGDDLARELMQINPKIPIILCTGYSTRIDQKRAADIGIRALVFKPVLKKDLAASIRKVLDGD